jgi:hypothetical protein
MAWLFRPLESGGACGVFSSEFDVDRFDGVVFNELFIDFMIV